MRLLYSCLPSSAQENNDGVMATAINSVLPARRAMYESLEEDTGEGENQKLFSSRPSNPASEGYDEDGLVRQMYQYLSAKVAKRWGQYTEYDKIEESGSDATDAELPFTKPLHDSYQVGVGPSVPLTYQNIGKALEAKASGCCEKCCARLEQIKAIVQKTEFPLEARAEVWKSLKNDEVVAVYQIIRKAGFASELRVAISPGKIEKESVDVHIFYL